MPNAILAAWIAGCNSIRVIKGGYVFVWQKSEWVLDEKEVKGDGRVTSRAYRGIPFRIVETTMPIEIGTSDIINAGLSILRSGKSVEQFDNPPPVFHVGDMVIFDKGIAPVAYVLEDSLSLAWENGLITVPKSSCELYNRNNPEHRKRMGWE